MTLKYKLLVSPGYIPILSNLSIYFVDCSNHECPENGCREISTVTSIFMVAAIILLACFLTLCFYAIRLCCRAKQLQRAYWDSLQEDEEEDEEEVEPASSAIPSPTTQTEVNPV
jgi:hypothetical protein